MLLLGCVPFLLTRYWYAVEGILLGKEVVDVELDVEGLEGEGDGGIDVDVDKRESGVDVGYSKYVEAEQVSPGKL